MEQLPRPFLRGALYTAPWLAAALHSNKRIIHRTTCPCCQDAEKQRHEYEARRKEGEPEWQQPKLVGWRLAVVGRRAFWKADERRSSGTSPVALGGRSSRERGPR